MDDKNNYYKDGVARVLDILKDTFGDYFKMYYDDELSEVPESNLPCVMVSEGTGTVSSGATGTDNVTEQIVIIVSLNTKDDFGASAVENLTGSRLRRIVKGQYPEGHAKAGQYHEKTVMYALRKHYTLDDAVINNAVETDFSVAQRGQEVYTKEAYVTLNLQRLAFVPSRDE